MTAAMRAIANLLRPLSAGLRMLVIFTVILGVAYPMLITGLAQAPGVSARADGSMDSVDGREVGSKLIGQSFTNSDGHPLVQYFQSRPSAAGQGYDPTTTSASNLGPESIVDVLPDPSLPDRAGTPSLLTQVCARSLVVGRLEGVSGARPYCTADGVGAVLAVFYAAPSYRGAVSRVVSVNQACPAHPFLAAYAGVRVECATFGQDYAKARITPIRGDAPAHPPVPPDAVTASASGLDPEISPAYARLQEARVARVRGVTVAQIQALVDRFRAGRDLGFIGEPRVNVLQLNVALDATYPDRK